MTRYKLGDGTTFNAELKEIDFTDEELDNITILIFMSFCQFYEVDRNERWKRYLKYMENNNE